VPNKNNKKLTSTSGEYGLAAPREDPDPHPSHKNEDLSARRNFNKKDNCKRDTLLRMTRNRLFAKTIKNVEGAAGPTEANRLSV
jgi:hypothetical protein